MKPIKKNLNLKSKEEETNQNFPNLTPRRGSLPGDFNRPSPRTPKFPLTSPTTPQSTSPTRLNFTTFSPVLENFEEVSETLDNLLSKGNKRNSNNFLNKVLDQKENEIKRLENEKQKLLQEKANWEKTQLKVKQLEKNLLQQSKKIEELKNEVKETGDDFYQTDQKVQEIQTQLNQANLNIRQLEQKLSHEINENDWLRSSFRSTKEELLVKVEELANLKKLNQLEKSQWQKTFTEQEEKYEIEKKDREEKFAHQFKNLRVFQNTENPLPLGRGRPLHKKTFSTNSLPTSRANSPRGSFYENDNPIKPSPLFMEITKGNLFSNLPTDSPTSPTTEEIEQSLDSLLVEVNDFATEQVNNQELLTELQTLKENQTQLENAYKTIFDEKVEQERLLKNFNEKELAWEKERQEFEKLLYNYTQKEQDLQTENQNLKEELAERDYQLSETKSKKNQAEKMVKETRFQLKDKENKVANEKQEINRQLDNLEEKESELSALIEQAEILLKIKN
ncbi:MAG: hypothetical protein I3273_05115 [Candidatus Moeniiplasma glomeromycotorum]|nr:hypothetical protein [Candidatus Moeniiplasma glomeromycotorum]MCE8169473.1 hypothetical protein [Candidatus Moeniiplasma glomeromycotorum]